LVLLNASEPQVNENGNGNGATESNQRCPNGTGGERNTSTYEQWDPTPGAKNLCMTIATNMVINEVDSDTAGTDALEFIELYDGGTGNTALDGLVLVVFNGSNDLSYNLGGHSNGIDLDGYTTDANGYFVLGNSGVASADITFNNNSLQNGADAVALYIGDGADFPSGTAVTATNLLDALVYDTSDADDVGLLVLLNASEPQVNENGNGNGATESNQRCPNGAGGQRNTSGYTQMSPSPDTDNPCLAIDLELTKIANQTLVFEGDTISFTLTVSNTSTNQDATTVVVRDYLPDTTTLVQNVTAVNCPQGTTSFPAANTLEWTVGTVAQGGSYSCDVQMDVRTGTDGLTLDNYAEVYSVTETTDPDSTPGNFTGTNFEDDADVASNTVGSPAACGTAATLISAIQGPGAVSPEDGNIHTIEGIVAGDFQTSSNLRGFFIQEEIGDQDGNPATSEGIFVYDGNTPAVDVNVGDLVRVTGTVDEYFELTELTSVSSVILCSIGNSISPTTINMPVTTLDTWEQHEGMLINIPQTLYATENYFQGQYGEVLLSTGGRLFNPTNVVEPGAPAIAMQTTNNLNVIQLEDGKTTQNPDPTPYLGANNTLRAGDTLPGLTGLLNYAYDAYEVHPTGPINFTRVNNRPGSPSLDPGNLKVASFNTLNYFTTLDTGAAICGPASNMDCRGANTAFEFTRQKTKIVAAIINMDADVVGLMEIENHPTDDAVIDLVDGLNAVAGPGTYASISTGTIGTDAIKVALIYKPATVSPLGSFAILDSSVDPTFIDTKNRPSLIQTFEEVATGEIFTVSVNHLKSKGSDCNAIGDPDTGDGQGNCNITRTTAATALINYLATDPTGSGDEDFLIIGDLNSYAKEDPIDAIKAGGYYDLIDFFIGLGSYSYVFDGQAGYLDHALATMPLKLQVKDVQEWHINADEPAALDYNDWNPIANYSPDQYRASDHDPVLISLILGDSPYVTDTDPADGSIVIDDTTSATITFSKDVLGDGSAQAANNVDNYMLLEDQGDGFQTVSCATAAVTGVDPADTSIVINSATYDAATFTATINVNDGVPLTPGEYRLYICGTTSIEDLDGHKLNGGASDSIADFTMLDPDDYPYTAATNPDTGTTLDEGISSAAIFFSKEVLADYSAQAANNVNNYLLLESQGDGFQTASCAAAAVSGVDPADTQIVVNSAVQQRSRTSMVVN
ncbi:MAG: ExeM/NucH family extracellular endonuclease, partial [Anaerolineales bacterium]